MQLNAFCTELVIGMGGEKKGWSKKNPRVHMQKRKTNYPNDPENSEEASSNSEGKDVDDSDDNVEGKTILRPIHGKQTFATGSNYPK